MRAVQEREVVVELRACVVILDRDEERLAEGVALREVERRVGQRPVLAGDERPVVRTGAIFAGELEASLIQRVRAEGRDELAARRVRRVALRRVGAGAP